MNALRDVWRVRCRTYREGDTSKPYAIEALWCTPFEATAEMAARDAAIGITQHSMVPLGSEHYPRIKEVTAFRMDCGMPVEAAKVVVRIERNGDRPRLTDGQDVMELTYEGSAVYTKNGWKESLR